ncbi:ImmA/IrrE family metallo-endopeptidase [Amycolatopsis pithecellobii]|uniref:ImmA/IrrE family metallo-endopeptidase n=1 Tax=Amycolatopsis pithecellobii TaxID=664692 RepID=A0A6N7Z492_9PSEU|nr:ImmA/IrrE family metallo-endopeptidase [Amycolatopsis pithecellobii]MTD55211.1 ImmA/IrrE family metallo-endopeptidase [Amycolatopsis pithecellobii]
MATKHVPITGQVLAWAIEDAGSSRSLLARRLEVAATDIDSWIREQTKPSTSQFRAMAKELGRPPSFFFLSQPPTTKPAKADFRTYADSDREPGQETIQGIRLAQKVQRTTVWVSARTDAASIYIPPLSIHNNSEKAGQRLREWLNWTVDEQTSDESTDARATRALRFALQEKGIIVMNLTLDEGVTRGFSLHHQLAPVIAVNTRDHHRARLFSYAHELVHLTLGSDAVCGTHGNRGVEAFCNKVAAALLLPAREFRDYVRLTFGNTPITTTAQVVTIRNHFRVSIRAAAIRAENLGLAEVGLFDTVNRETEKKGKGGRYTPGNERTKPRIRIDQYGHAFVNTLFGAEEAGVLRRQQVQQLLQVSESELASVKALALAGAET